MDTLREIFDGRMSYFVADHCWNEEQDGVIRAFLNTGSLVELVYGPATAGRVMASLKAMLSGEAGAADDPAWRETWNNVENGFGWPPLFDELHVLRAFAEFGIFQPIDWSDKDVPQNRRLLLEAAEDVPGTIRGLAAHVDRILQLAPGHVDAPYDALVRTQRKALARLKLDLGQPITPSDLADLSGVSLKRIQNAAYEAAEGAPVIDKKGFITEQSAREWLRRKGFKFSIWPLIAELDILAEDWGRDVSVDPALLVNDDVEQESRPPEEYTFIPVATDQSKFLPALRGPAGYRIGPKGAEDVIDDYLEALAELTKAAVPRWRRPNESGNWGIVSGRSWERIPRAQIDREIAEAKRDAPAPV